jgi:hypothetical protein
MDCPVVDVRGVIRLAPIELPHRFLSSFNQGSLVEEVLSSNRPPTANFCFNIQLLQRLRHDPGFPRLAGVVVDNKENLIKSYLVKWSDVACEFILTRASDPSYIIHGNESKVGPDSFSKGSAPCILWAA